MYIIHRYVYVHLYTQIQPNTSFLPSRQSICYLPPITRTRVPEIIGFSPLWDNVPSKSARTASSVEGSWVTACSHCPCLSDHFSETTTLRSFGHLSISCSLEIGKRKNILVPAWSAWSAWETSVPGDDVFASSLCLQPAFCDQASHCESWQHPYSMTIKTIKGRKSDLFTMLINNSQHQKKEVTCKVLKIVQN